MWDSDIPRQTLKHPGCLHLFPISLSNNKSLIISANKLILHAQLWVAQTHWGMLYLLGNLTILFLCNCPLYPWSFSCSEVYSVCLPQFSLFSVSMVYKPGDLAKGMRTAREFDFGDQWWNHLPQIGTETHVLGLELNKTLLGTWTHVAGTHTQSNPCLGVKPPWLGLKSSQNTEYLVVGPSEAQVLDVSLQKEFSERQIDK